MRIRRVRRIQVCTAGKGLKRVCHQHHTGIEDSLPSTLHWYWRESTINSTLVLKRVYHQHYTGIEESLPSTLHWYWRESIINTTPVLKRVYHQQYTGIEESLPSTLHWYWRESAFNITLVLKRVYHQHDTGIEESLPSTVHWYWRESTINSTLVLKRVYHQQYTGIEESLPSTLCTYTESIKKSMMGKQAETFGCVRLSHGSRANTLYQFDMFVKSEASTVRGFSFHISQRHNEKWRGNVVTAQCPALRSTKLSWKKNDKTQTHARC